MARTSEILPDSSQRSPVEKGGDTCVVLMPVNVFQLNPDRVFTWLLVVDIASSMRREVGLSILKVWDLEFPDGSNE